MPYRSKAVCSLCDEHPSSKMASIYWAWTWPTGDRRAYKQMFDATCYATVANTMHFGSPKAICPVCNSEPVEEPEVLVWATIYVPGDERHDDCVVFHVACFEAFADYFVKGATRLADRGSQAGGPPPATPGNAWPSWGAMGIEPA